MLCARDGVGGEPGVLVQVGDAGREQAAQWFGLVRSEAVAGGDVVEPVQRGLRGPDAGLGLLEDPGGGGADHAEGFGHGVQGAALERNRTSGRAQESAKASAANGIAATKTTESASEKALTTPMRTSGGSCATAVGVRLAVPPLSPDPAGRAARLSAKWALKIVLNTETPMDPPIERKNVAAEVAVPSCSVGHGVLHGEHEHLHDQPEPDAEHEHVQPGQWLWRVGTEPRQQEHGRP